MQTFQYESTNSFHKKCGCYVRNADLLNKHPNQNILIPLKHCDYQLQIVNAMTNITLKQIYQNPTDQFLQIQYSFPINPNACVYRFIAIFGKNRIEGIIKQKEQAKREYEKGLNSGKKVAYGEINSQSKDILTLKVGNIGPKQELNIEIVYLQELGLNFNTFYQLHLPATITPRYLNSLSQESLLAGYRKYQQGSQSTVGTFTWSFQILLKTTYKLLFHNSKTHKLKIVSQNNRQTQTILTLQNACLPNKDFVFTYTTQNYELPSYIFGRTDKSSSVMLSFIPKFCTLNVNDAYKASMQGKILQGDINSAKGQYIFLLDRSGSMSGMRIEKAKQALILFIKSLPEDSFFDVVSFGLKSTRIFNKTVQYSNNNIDYAVSSIKQMNADMGGTEIYNPLLNLLIQQPKQGYPKQIFLLTDGGVSDTQTILKMITKNNKYSRVHSIGIGNGASQSLIIGSAKKGKGIHVFISDSQDPSQKIIQLLSDSLSAVINKITLKYDENVVQSIIPNPKSIPYFLKGDIVNFYITFKGQLTNKTNFSFSYQDTQNKLPYQTSIQIDPQTTNQSFIDKMAHFKRIRILQESHANNSNLEQTLYFVKKIDKKQQIIKQSIENQILSEFTAFICVQKQLIDGKYEEIKQTGKVKVFIDSPPPIQYEEQQRYIKKSSANKSYQKSSWQPQKMACESDKDLQSMMDQIQMGSMSYSLRSADMSSNYRPNSNKGSIGSVRTQKRMQYNALAPKAMARSSNQPGILDSISGFFKGIFSKSQKKQVSKSVEIQKQSSQPIQNRKIQKIEEKKQQKIQKLQKDSNLIDRIVAEQDSSGYWKDISLISKLFNANVEKQVKNQKNILAAAAYLIAKWIQKYYPHKQYSLIVKKGINYAQKQATNYNEFSLLFDKYLQ